MPIYAYRCEECGFAKDVLQKISDPQLTECPACGKSTFKKQLTAAGFQLKGTGWYVTDFRGGNAPATGVAGGAKEGGAKADAPSTTSSTTPAAPAASPTVAPATGSGDKK
ncbi:MAG TPA: FmdB family zinc ribbon protein [Pseudoduganella sp.]|jgi:putative FmdB family regulatory protein